LKTQDTRQEGDEEEFCGSFFGKAFRKFLKEWNPQEKQKIQTLKEP
jgi:hypothetical protein